MESPPERSGRNDNDPRPSGITVFAPSTCVTVTVERDTAGDDDIHFHAGGQGLWVARAIRNLGEPVRLCTSCGGESGVVLEALIRREGIGLDPVRVGGSTPAYVHDRRGGTRVVVAERPASPLKRHELDDLFDTVLASAMHSSLVVITGRPKGFPVPAAFYRRLGADLATAGVPVVGDLHGAELAAFLEGGKIDLLKVSDVDLEHDGIEVPTTEDRFGVLEELDAAGARQVVMSRAEKTALALIDGRRFEAQPPMVSSPDFRGSGDAMTGAFAVAVRRDLPVGDLLALGCGAGAASATRHGLATADARLIAEYASMTDVVEC